MEISAKRKLLVAAIIVLLWWLYAIGVMVAFNNNDGNEFRMAVLTILRFTPDLALIVLGAMLLGPKLGAFIGVIVLLGGVVAAGTGLFTPTPIWRFPAFAFAQYLAATVVAGLIITKKGSSYGMSMLAVFCALVLGHFASLVVSSFGHGATTLGERLFVVLMLTMAWVRYHGFGVIILSLIVPLVYLALGRVLAQPEDVHNDTQADTNSSID